MLSFLSDFVKGSKYSVGSVVSTFGVDYSFFVRTTFDHMVISGKRGISERKSKLY